MALNPSLIDFFIENIGKSNMQTFGSEVAHLFAHIDNEVKENPIYEKYEGERDQWKNWPVDGYYSHWSLPVNYDDAKSLIYNLYRTIGEEGPQGYYIPSELMHIESERNDDRIIAFNNQFLDYFQQVLSEIINANPEIETGNVQKVKGDTVFIIHGHDSHLKTEVQLLLVRAGVNNIVLHEQSDKGRTIIDKLIEESAPSNYAIALLSPDDELKDGTSRARQNVILEIGYFLGKLGKERVRLLKKGNIEIPSDLSGILYEEYDSTGAWKMKICKELMAVGIYVDMETVDMETVAMKI